MRTTIDLPDRLIREAKAAAALRGTTLKELVAAALERELRLTSPPDGKPKVTIKLPIVRLSKGRKLDLTGFDLDDLLA